MPSQPFILFAADGAWRIGTIRDGRPAFANEPLDRIDAALQSLGYRGESVVLAIPAAWCLAASIDAAAVGANDYKAMLFRLEEQVPLAAEEMVADFLPAGARALGVCARLDVLRPLIDALEARGIPVQSIAPAALLSAQQFAGRTSDQILLIGEGDHVSVIGMRGHTPESWALVPSTPDDLKLQLSVARLEFAEPPPVRACGVSSPLPDAAESLGDEESAALAALTQARQVLEGRQSPWGELRRGPLAIRDRLRQYRRPLNAALAAAALFLIVLTAALLVRAHRYENRARWNDAELTSEFARAFPGWTVPGDVTAVIASEHQKATAQHAGAVPAVAKQSALRTMHALLSRLPPDVKFDLDHATFEDVAFELQGKLRSYEDADKLAAAARQAGLDVAPPQTRRGEDGVWTFTLHGARPGAASSLARQE